MLLKLKKIHNFMKISYSILITTLMLFSSCTFSSQKGILVYQDTVVLPDATVDTAYYVDYNGYNLFKIISGGNLDIVNSFKFIFNDKEYLLFTISDISQEFLLYFIIYDIAYDKLYQTDKIYLPYLEIDYYGDLSCTDLGINKNRVSFLLQNRHIDLELRDIVMDEHNIMNFNK